MRTMLTYMLQAISDRVSPKDIQEESELKRIEGMLQFLSVMQTDSGQLVIIIIWRYSYHRVRERISSILSMPTRLGRDICLNKPRDIYFGQILKLMYKIEYTAN